MSGKDEAKFFEHAIEWDDRKVARVWDYRARRSGGDGSYFSRSLAIVCYVFLAFHSTAPWKCSTLVAVLGSFGITL